MTQTEFEDILRGWVNGILGYRTIFSYSGRPRPVKPYVMLNFFQRIDISTRCVERTELPDNTTDNVYSNLQEAIVSINAYGPGAYDIVENIRGSTHSVAVREYLTANSVGIGPKTITERIPAIVDKDFEERARFDMSFFIRSSYTENIETIKKIEITNEIDGYTTIIE
jgi:hypothetical protein